MFSGIVEECARVVGIEKELENVHFTLQCSFVDELKIDQSVAHNGVCLTVVRIENGTYTVTAMKETLDRSNLGLLQIGDLTQVDDAHCHHLCPVSFYFKDAISHQIGARVDAKDNFFAVDLRHHASSMISISVVKATTFSWKSAVISSFSCLPCVQNH